MTTAKDLKQQQINLHEIDSAIAAFINARGVGANTETYLADDGKVLKVTGSDTHYEIMFKYDLNQDDDLEDGHDLVVLYPHYPWLNNNDYDLECCDCTCVPAFEFNLFLKSSHCDEFIRSAAQVMSEYEEKVSSKLLSKNKLLSAKSDICELLSSIVNGDFDVKENKRTYGDGFRTVVDCIDLVFDHKQWFMYVNLSDFNDFCVDVKWSHRDNDMVVEFECCQDLEKVKKIIKAILE